MDTPKNHELSANWLAKSVAAESGGNIVLLVGIPASGKSTLCNELTGLGFTRLSMDDIRKELYGDESVMGDPKQVGGVFQQRLDEALAEGVPVLIDNTNCHRGARSRIIGKAREAGYKNVWLLVMDVPLKVCLKRNKLRQRHVPEEVLRSMHKQLHGEAKPSADEGYVLWVRPGSDQQHLKVRSL